MADTAGKTIAVCGATGRQGGAVTRYLLRDGWTVRALTRRPGKAPARALVELGAELVEADMEDPASLTAAFRGAHGVFSVQNGIDSGFDAEVRQGRNVADAAKGAGVGHLVYGSAGTGKPGTGIPSWEAKVPVEEHIRETGMPATVLRPKAFMELMTDPKFFPAVGTWRIMPRLTGLDRPIPWLSVPDLGAIVAAVFADPARWLGAELSLASDVKTLGECRDLHRSVMGRSPRTFPMPEWLFDRFTRKDPTIMWRWLRTGEVDRDTSATRAILPSALTVEEWLAKVVRPSAKKG